MPGFRWRLIDEEVADVETQATSAIRAYLVKVFHREFYKPCSVTHITYHVPSITPGRPKKRLYMTTG
jgi:hypothetical protein